MHLAHRPDGELLLRPRGLPNARVQLRLLLLEHVFVLYGLPEGKERT